MVQAKSIHAKPQGPIQGLARCGLDVPYAEKRAAARRELESTMMGRDKPGQHALEGIG